MEDWVVSRPIGRYLVRQPVGAEEDVDVVPGLRHDMVQSFDLVVSHAASNQLYTLVVGTMPVLSEHDRAVIAQALLATRRPEVVFLLEALPDSATAECAQSVDPAAAAMAVGVVITSISGQRGTPVTVDVNGTRWTATATLEQQRWHGTVRQ
jgi:hypothetical protein